MAIYIGKGVPGQPGYECREFEGFPVSKCGNYWGNGPVDSEGYLIVGGEVWNTPKFKHKSKYHK